LARSDHDSIRTSDPTRSAVNSYTAAADPARRDPLDIAAPDHSLGRTPDMHNDQLASAAGT